jgi:hypothetical protein
MSAKQDPVYLQLYQDYAKAIRAYSNAIESRKRVRESLEAKRKKPPPLRRPVGAPPSHVKHSLTQTRAASTANPPKRRIYMEEILGWATLTASAPIESKPDPAADFDVDKLYDKTSLELYWNAKTYYERTKKAFFDYVHKQNLQLHRERAKSALSDAAYLQLLGVNGADEKYIEEAKKEIEQACQNAWRLCQTSATPKSQEMKILILESLAEEQFVGLDESPVAKAMQAEALRIINN